MKTLLDQFTRHQKIFFLLLTILAGICILWPYHNFQYMFAQGDHGRDLYCAKKTMEGAMPYRDYSWPLGPFMPYYYGTFFRVFGVSIQSLLLGQNLLFLGAGILLYLACSVFLSPVLSFICPLWYWTYRAVDFFETYNHTGGIFLIILVLYLLFRYIKKDRPLYIYAGFTSLFLLMLIRLNIGIASLAAFFISACAVDATNRAPHIVKKRLLYVFLSAIILLVAALVYWFLLHPLPSYIVNQSLPYDSSYRTDISVNSLTTLFYLLEIMLLKMTRNWGYVLSGIILLLASIRTVLFLKEYSGKIQGSLKVTSILFFSSLFLFITFNLHEFLMSGANYRIDWVRPITLMAIFGVIDFGTRGLKYKSIRYFVIIAMFFIAFFKISDQHRAIREYKSPRHLLNIGKNNVYLANPPQWIQTVKQTTDFLSRNVPRGEKILAVPFEPLYYFLSGRDSATRQLIFFDHLRIPPEQEKDIIRQLEYKKVNFIILSSRSATSEIGMGTFGKTYGLLLDRYIRDHFNLVATFGDWNHEPGWTANHGVKIFRRKN